MTSNPRLADLWNRLPVFKTVAQTEHLPTASKMLHITAPAISRTIRLLEDEIGQPLFRREGRNLQLNAAGRRLLNAVSQVMESLDGTLMELASDPMEGPIRISTIGVITDSFVLPAVMELNQEYPSLKPNLLLKGTSDANDLLARGHLDVAFYYEGLTDERLNIEHLGNIGAGIYCGEGHPLFDANVQSLEEVLEFPFSIPQEGDNGQVQDGWPVEVHREIGMRITLLTSNLEVALSGRFVTVLPDVIAREYVESGRLKRFPFEVLDPIPVYGAHRKADVPASAARKVLEYVRKKVRQE